MTLASLLNIETVFVLAAAYLAYSYIVKVVSPLHKIPGPWYTAISRISYNVLLVRGTQLEYVERLHRKYGPVVRLAPDMVSICDPDVAHEIYHTHRFLKGPLYRGFDLTGRPNLFSMRHPNLSEFKLRKRLMAPAFTPSALRGLEPVVNQAGLQPLLRTFDKHAESGDTVNAMDLFMRANLSIMGAIAFGKSFNLIEEYHPILEWLSDILELGVLKSAVGETAAIKLRPKLHRNHQAAIEFARKAISDRRARAEVAADSLQRYLDVYSENDEESPLTEADVVGEMLVQLIAGTDTTATSLTWAVYCILQDPKCLARLRAELDEAIPSPDTHVTHDMVSHLPYLNAVINETLRIHPVGAGEPQRIVPEGGFVACGYHLPAGTIVMAGQYPLHHLDKVWPEPFTFNPDRWLVDDEKLHEMKRYFFPFSMGVRSCVGRHLATMELRVVLASLVRRYDMTHMPGDDMVSRYQLIVRPRGGALTLRLKRRMD